MATQGRGGHGPGEAGQAVATDISLTLIPAWDWPWLNQDPPGPGSSSGTGQASLAMACTARQGPGSGEEAIDLRVLPLSSSLAAEILATPCAGRGRILHPKQLWLPPGREHVAISCETFTISLHR
ncbi:hypothetical protein TURU_010586 [Turdus rufiventris]|nr:hypothetical protein TURU_010586 [Turdus rufiventris]